jgi:hypothetical protein
LVWSEETPAAHGQVPFDPGPFAHLPHIPRHVVTAVGAHPLIKPGHIRRPVDPQLAAVAEAGVKVVSPRPPPLVGPPGGLLPLGFRREALPRPGGISPGIVPSHSDHRLQGVVPPLFLQKDRGPMAGLLDEFPILIVGHRMDVDVVIFQGRFAGRHLGHEDRVLGAIQDEDLAQFALRDSHGEFARGDQDHLDGVNGGNDFRRIRGSLDQIGDRPEILVGHETPPGGFWSLL